MQPLTTVFHLSATGWSPANAPPPVGRVETWRRTTTWHQEADQFPGWYREHRDWTCLWADGSDERARDRLRQRFPIPDTAGKRVRIT